MNGNTRYLFVLFSITAVLCISMFFIAKGTDKARHNNAIIAESSQQESDITTDEPTKNETEDKTSVLITNSSEENVTETVTEFLWIDINTAGTDELVKLNGIGETIAQRIVDYRDKNGDFDSIGQIMNVSGIGEEKFKAIRAHIYVANPGSEAAVTEAGNATDISEEIITTVEEEEITAEKQLEDIAPVNLNTATEEELMLLPYVDEEIAKEIIRIREGLGRYRNTLELLFVEELEQKEVAEIMEFVTVGQ